MAWLTVQPICESLFLFDNSVRLDRYRSHPESGDAFRMSVAPTPLAKRTRRQWKSTTSAPCSTNGMAIR